MLTFFLLVVTGEVRCFCNEPACESTSYMCTSGSGCFAHFSYTGSVSQRSRHGCVESLPRDDREICKNAGDILRTRNGPDKEWPILMCCKEDLCNHMGGAEPQPTDSTVRDKALAPPFGSPDVNIHVDTRPNASTFNQGKYSLFSLKREMFLYICLFDFQLKSCKNGTLSLLLIGFF